MLIGDELSIGSVRSIGHGALDEVELVDAVLDLVGLPELGLWCVLDLELAYCV